MESIGGWFASFFFNEFHENGVVTKELGASFIALIPKKEGAFILKNFHPISLIGSLYNNLANVLANRLWKVFARCYFKFPRGIS